MIAKAAGAVLLRLFAEPAQQRLTRNAVAEARIVVALGDQGGAAGAVVDHEDVAAIAGEIKRGRQPGRAAADDQAVERGLWRCTQTGLPPVDHRRETAGRDAGSLQGPYCEPMRIEAGWPGSLKRLPVLVILVPLTFRIEMSWSR